MPDVRLLFALASAPLALQGCKHSASDAASAEERASGGAASGSAASASAVTANAPLRDGATCVFPERIHADVTIAAGCVADVTHDVLVADGSTLTLEPGVRLRFDPSAWLEVGHRGSRLVARGTPERPVVFTSSAAQPKPGDWIGLVFDDAVGEGTVLEHAVVEYGGRESHGGHGALTVFRAFPAGRLGVRDVKFRHNLTAVSDLHDDALFDAFERNTFSGNARALRVRAGVLAAFGKDNEIADPVEVVGGAVTRAGAFPRTERPIRVLEPITVGGRDAAVASLTLQKGTVLRFGPKTWLEVGVDGPADLQARGAVFTSDAESPAPGDWVGLLFGARTRHALVSDSRIEWAGAEEHGGDAAVTFVGEKSWQALDVTFLHVAFKGPKQAHFSSNGDGCNKALDPRQGMAWAGFLEPCR